MSDERADKTCPSCGGAGGGPLGRAGGAWDTDDYVCPRCAGLGILTLRDVEEIPVSGPGVVKASPSTPPVALPGLTAHKRVVGKA